MRKKPPLLCTVLATSAFLSLHAGAETLNSLAEFGNAATANAASGAGTPRGANFDNAAMGEYTITAGGSDFWGNNDRGSFIWDNTQSRAAGENFSVVVRSVSVAADPLEGLATQWGRTGPMARKTPDQANSANVAHIRKSGGDPNSANPAETLIQGRAVDGQGTNRGPGEDGEHRNHVENTANGSVRDTPIWLALHRVNGTWYSTWAVDNAGTPGVWSDSRTRAASDDMSGEVWVGLAHQSHNITPEVNTAVFDNFAVTAFDPDLGDFPLIPSCEVTFSGTDILLTASTSEAGSGAAPSDVEWEVRAETAILVPTPGGIDADIYLAGNAGNLAAFQALGAPNGSTRIETIRWSSNNYTQTNAAGVNLFAQAVPGSFGGGQDQYGVKLSGEIFIPSDTARAGQENVRFHDGVDDYCYLEIDGVPLIDDNTWSNLAGVGNGGGAQATFDCSDAKFDDGEWVSFCMVTWEGGGGDDAVLNWDALDRTGTDDVTGATDGVLNSYNPGNLPDGQQVSFDHDRSDEIPSANLRAPAPQTVSVASGDGQPNAEMIGSIPAGTVALQVYGDGMLCATISVTPTLESADFTSADVATIVLKDVGMGGTSDVDETSLTMTVDGNPVSPVVTKDGVLTTIEYTFPSPPTPYTIYSFEITGTTTPATGSAPISFATSARSWPIFEELRAGLEDPPNASVGWDYMEFMVIPTLGGNLGGGAQGFIDAQIVINTAAMPDARMDQPFINHSDPDSNPISGEWCPDLPILTDAPGGQDQFVTYARTIITIGEGEEGPYTFRVTGDDGYGLRVAGGNFVSIAGNGNNTLDPRDPSVAFFPEYGGNSNAYAVCEFPAAGDYLVEFFGFEGGGGAYQELAWAPGSFTALNQTFEWSLVGNTSEFVPQSCWAAINESVLPPDPSGNDCGWSTYIWYGATVGNLANTVNFINGADPGAATATVLPYLDHQDTGGTGVFPNNDPVPGAPAGDTNNIAMIARAYVVAPADGDYTLQVRSDDGFLLRWVDPANQFHSISGGGTLHPSALNEAYFAAGTGDSNTRASVFLPAGTHELLFLWWEGNGGAHFEVSAAPGVEPNHGAAYELLTTTPSGTNLYLGKPALPSFDITEIIYDSVNDTFTLTWTSEEERTYALFWDTDLSEFTDDIDDGIASGGETTTFGPFPNPSPGSPRIYFRAAIAQ